MNQMLGELATMIARYLTAEINVEYQLADDLWGIGVNKVEYQDALLNMLINAQDVVSCAADCTSNIVIEVTGLMPSFLL